jgi:hypothetical protein
MNVKYSILFRVNFRHSYFADGMLKCFSVKPTADTEKFLLSNGMLLKATQDGFMIAFESFNNGTAYTSEEILASNETLTFALSLNDPLFFNYTAIEATDIGTSVFYFHNHDPVARSSSLHASEYAGAEDIIPVKDLPQHFFNKPFALVEIQLNHLHTEEYLIRFKEKSTYWRYLLVSDHLRELHKPAVLNGSVVFKGPVEIELPGKRMALAFESGIPVSIRQRSEKTFQLVESYDADSNKGKTVIKALPHPDINIISKLNTQDRKEYSEIVI